MKKGKPNKEQFTLLFNEKGGVVVSSKKDTEGGIKQGETWFYLGFVGQIGYTIALPIVCGTLLGKYIDDQWKTYPKATLLLLIAGGVISIIGFIKTIQELIQRK